MNKGKLDERIKAVRKALRMTQEEFGSQIGVKGNTITGYERGTRVPSDAVINNLCRTFKVNQTWLRTGDGEMDLPDVETAGALERLYSDHNCNPLERKFLDGYFSLDESERDAFCKLLAKMFPDAVEALAGPDPLSRPFSGFQEAEPLDGPDIASLLQKQPAEMSAAEISAVAAELGREMLEEKEAAEKSSLSSGSTTSSNTKMA